MPTLLHFTGENTALSADDAHRRNQHGARHDEKNKCHELIVINADLISTSDDW